MKQLFQSPRGRTVLLVTLLTVILGGCQLPDPPDAPGHGGGRPSPSATATPAPTPIPTPVCTGSPQPASWNFSPTKIVGSPSLLYTIWDIIAFLDPNWAPDARYLTQQNIYFKADDLLRVFNDPSIQIDSVSLDFTVAGRDHQQSAKSIQVDVNGIRTFGASSAQNTSGTKYRLQLGKMKLNGAEPFATTLRRIAMKRGQLILVLQGTNLKVKNVKLVVNGVVGINCPPTDPEATPTPVPSPTPIPAPQTSIVSVNPTGSTVGSSTMSIEFNGDQPGLSFLCSLNGAAASACTSPIAYSNLVSGPQSFKVVAVNASGVSDPVGASYNWTVDLVPPSVTIVNAGSLPALTNAADVAFTLSASEPSTYKCSIDGGAYATCTSPVSYYGLADGIHQFSVRGIDSHGNQGEPALFSWSVDRTVPIAVFVDVVPVENITHSTSSTLTFAANESAAFECRLDQEAFAACTSPVALSQLADGLHAFQIRAKDLAGNSSAIATYSWTVDTLAPVLSITRSVPASGLTSASAVAVEFSASEASHYQCSFDGGAWVVCSSPFSQSMLSEGPHQADIVAIDLAGNPSATASVAWVMDHTMPTLAWGAMTPSAASRIRQSSFSAAVTSSEPVTLSCSLNNNPLAAQASPVQLSGLSEGNYQLAVSGRDAAGNDSGLLIHAFTVDLTAPVASLSSAISGVSGQNTNTLTFSANEAASFECSLDQAGFALCSSPVMVSGLADGTHLFEVRAIDLAGNVSSVKNANWSVDSTPPIVTALTLEVGRNSVTVNWTTSEPATSRVDWGPGVTVVNSTPETSRYDTNHSVTVSGLNASSIYTVIAAGQDDAGNDYSSAKKQFRTSP